MNTSLSNAECVSSPDQHVTAVITHQVKAGRQDGYEEWIKGISAVAREFAGHLGVSILRPQPGSSLDYVIVLQFATCDHLTAWLGSDIRNTWIERVKPLIQEQENIQVLSGLESWFQLPKQQNSQAPKRYKQAILIWVGVMIVSLGVSPLIAPLLSFLPWLLKIAVNVAITVALLSYVIMPRLTQWFKGWLFAN
ncbi:antibiotic biosynthesis monooxygenase [Leptolyngbya sp. Heron Island J]|uniref:antibiotic biosynthesis monooxygenase n=1 Tax=Leptolyngbya sp. Heron Island J TaxID=1385935 RepID=UPI0003B98C8B|nr:antibiotic biosynthesis monooxygenase [Leptolyngbya sp. Heron Island J]ESA35985.1 antibiotic biosynthesis monooxygenase [Leptolyngbya sp. Heron Island J]